MKNLEESLLRISGKVANRIKVRLSGKGLAYQFWSTVPFSPDIEGILGIYLEGMQVVAFSKVVSFHVTSFRNMVIFL